VEDELKRLNKKLYIYFFIVFLLFNIKWNLIINVNKLLY
jgi:hypothetical protein